jgi:hypothetical protein
MVAAPQPTSPGKRRKVKLWFFGVGFGWEIEYMSFGVDRGRILGGIEINLTG